MARARLVDRLEVVNAVRILSEGGGEYAYRELGLDASAPPDADTARAIGEVVEARRVVWGSYQLQADDIALLVRIVNVQSGEVSPELTATATNWFEACDHVADQILEFLEIHPSEEERHRMPGWWTSSDRALECWNRVFAAKPNVMSFQDQEVLIREAVSADAEFAEGYLLAATIYANQGQLNQAEEAVRRALRIRPDFAIAQGALSQVLSRQGKLADAREAAEAAVRLAPDRPGILSLLGSVFLGQGDFDQALDCFARARELDPTDATTFAVLGLAHAEKGETNRALADLREAERLCFEDINAEQMMAAAYQQLGEHTRAVLHLERMLTLARAEGFGAPQMKTFEKRIEHLQATLVPVFVEAEMPVARTPETIQRLVAERLTEAEIERVPHSFTSTPDMQTWAEELTRGADTDQEKARALFAGMISRQPGKGAPPIRTAAGVFTVWGDPSEDISPQDYAKLYVVLARAVGLPAWSVYVDRDHRGTVVYKMCASVFVDGKCLLVDPPDRWLGAPYQSFVVLGDLEAIALDLHQIAKRPMDFELARIARNLCPASELVRLEWVCALVRAGQVEEAQRELEQIGEPAVGRWQADACRAGLALLKKDYQGTVEAARRSLDVHPASTTAYLNLGYALRELGRPYEARDALRAVLRHDPGPETALAARRVISQINEQVAEDRGDESVAESLLQAATEGDVQAQFELGISYLEERHGERNDAEAFRWLHQAALQQDEYAQYSVGYMYLQGQGVKQDAAKAAEWWRKAAGLGYSDAQFGLATLYLSGMGVPQDLEQVVIWTRRAVEQGNADAQTLLATLYGKGQGVEQDTAAATEWFRKAALQGHPGAQNGLGLSYANGQGVPRDYDKAVTWFRKAAEQGWAPAQRSLAVSYDNGNGVPQDVVEAYAWASLARNRSPSADSLLYTLAGRMNLDQLKIARERAVALRRTIPETVKGRIGWEKMQAIRRQSE